MKKIITISILGILILSGIGAVGLPTAIDVKQYNISEEIYFSTPELKSKGEYQILQMDNTNSWVDTPNYPMIPAYIKTYKFPFGTKIKNVEIEYSKTNQQELTKKIILASEPVSLQSEIKENILEKDENIYLSTEIYPKDDFYYSTHSGLDKYDHVIFLTVKCYPIRYIPVENKILFSNSLKINIEYQTPKDPKKISDNIDMVIIYPSNFISEILPLVDHKNSIGINTTYKSVEEIIHEYDGVDQPEQIKYYIKDLFDNNSLKYVLLIGGLKSQLYAKSRDDANQGTKGWYVPIRYSNLWDGVSGDFDPGYLCDLYYADLYDGEGNFSSWDTNGDGIFAAWSKPGTTKDDVDCYPDVYVGRLACRNKIEVKTMVNKIIKYETGTDSTWFNKMVVIGGDTFNDGGVYYEGEVENQKALDYMDGFEPVKIWASNRDLGGPVPNPLHILWQVSKGSGFLFFAGHGSPYRWDTYWPDEFGPDAVRAKGLWWYHIPFFFNLQKLPVCVVGGCHNSQFNITTGAFLLNESWIYGGAPECFSWWLTKKIGGGTIATIGNTGIGYGATGNSGDLDGDGINDPDCVERLGGYLETQFFKMYGEEGIDILGETWGAAITQYLTVYPPNNYQTDTKTVQQWVLLGDPSLKIGGY